MIESIGPAGALEAAVTQDGATLASLARQGPLVIAFLRHLG